MKKLIINFLIIFLLINNIIFNIFELPSWASYWDEMIEILVITYGLLYSIKRKMEKRYFVLTVLLFLIVSIGILANILFEYSHSADAIFRDVFLFLKFPMVLVFLKSTGIDKELAENFSIKIIKLFTIIIFIFGIISLFLDLGLSQMSIRNGIRPYQFLFNHPTFLVLYSVFSIALLESNFDKNGKKIYIIMNLITIFLTMRTKGFALIAIYLFLKFTNKWSNKLKVLYWVGVIFIGFLASYTKLLEYSSYSTSAREVFYLGSIELAKMCFPIGSGFGTFASHISYKYHSQIYNFIHIPLYASENAALVYGDTGFPYYIGQFGFMGIILIIIFGKKLLNMLNKNVQYKLPVNILLIYILIGLTSETILLNSGIELAFMLAIVSKKIENIKKEEDESEKNWYNIRTESK